jgi:hypothetical protein
MTRDPVLLEIQLRKDFNNLRIHSQELAGDLLRDFRDQCENPRLLNPADAPEQYHSVFHSSVKSCISDVNCN